VSRLLDARERRAVKKGDRAYLTNGEDNDVHILRHEGMQLIAMNCGELGVPFESPLQRYRKILVTEDPVTCLLCLGWVRE
jgi:hypothetical protein